MLKISIPTPCHEDWEKMTPDQTGRHCSACAKSVIDFTNMSDEEVKHFFINKKEDERICGRFKQTQLHRIVVELPPNIFNMRIAYWKKFLAACLLVFSTTLFSCETKIRGKVQAQIGISNSGTEEQKKSGWVGMTYVKTSEIIKPASPLPVSTQNIDSVEVLQGDIAIVPEDTAVVPVVYPVPDSTQQVEMPVKDTVYKTLEEHHVMGLPIKAVKTKNPPKADSANCKTINNFN